MYSPGEKAAWERLRELGAREAAQQARVPHEGGVIVLDGFGAEVRVDIEKREISSPDPEIDALVKKLGYFYNHVALWWILDSKGIPPTGRLIRPADLKGGQMFFRGTHVLPLERLAARYGADREGFLARAARLGGGPGGYGDASAEFHPAGSLPMHLILWLGDEEFPARADLLLDSAWELAVPLDIIWSAAMMVVLAML